MILFVVLTQRSFYTNCCRWNLHLPLPLVRHQVQWGHLLRCLMHKTAWQHLKSFPEPFQGEFSFSHSMCIILPIIRL